MMLNSSPNLLSLHKASNKSIYKETTSQTSNVHRFFQHSHRIKLSKPSTCQRTNLGIKFAIYWYLTTRIKSTNIVNK